MLEIKCKKPPYTEKRTGETITHRASDAETAYIYANQPNSNAVHTHTDHSPRARVVIANTQTKLQVNPA